MRGSAPPTVLVIDDSAIVRESTRSILEAAGMRVIVHDRSEGAVALVLSEQPDMLLLDVELPRISGDAIAAALLRTAPTHRTIVLLYSSLDRQVLRLKALKCGAHGFIQKTLDPPELIAQIRRWLADSQPNPESMSFPVSGTIAIRDARVEPEAPKPHRHTQRPHRAASWRPPARSPSKPPVRKTSGTINVGVPVVLFVDDELDVLDAYRRDFSGERLLGEFVQSANKALHRLQSPNPPDVVVSDILMPEMSGSELFYRAKAMDASWERRFVFVTGASSMSHVAQFLAGTDARVLYKPVDIERLRHAIRYAALARRVFSDARIRGR